MVKWGVFSQTPTNPWTPPEYFATKAVLIEWDFNYTIWPLYSELIEECSEEAEVILVVRNQGEEDDMISMLQNDQVSLQNISFVHVPCERMWIRDHGPLAIHTDTGIAYIDFDDLAQSGLDEELPTNLANLWGLESYALPYIMDGGNFMVNSFNTLFTTERIYTNNPNYSPEHIDSIFYHYMGIEKTIIVASQHNDYWGHIDMQIKLLDDSTFVISSCSPQAGPSYDSLEQNFNLLSSINSPFDEPYRIRRLPMADDWKTYANSLYLNNKLILPVYNHPFDSDATAVYQELLPNHQIVGINCNAIIGWEGAIHCIVMQLFDESQILEIKELSVRDNHIRVYPNPITSGQNLHILYSEEIGKAISAKLYQSNGVLVESISLINQTTGHSIFPWTHAPGTYLVELEFSNKNTESIRVVGK